MNIDELADKIISNMSNLWPNIYKIRYIYLELGKYLSKDTDFFFSCDNKLAEYGMTYDQIKEAYESKTGNNYKVICRSACEILKYILNKAGIKAEVIKQINKPINVNIKDKELLINHYFLAAHDNDKTYFMTLASDLPFIKEGMKTKLFANDIPYKRINQDGEEEQIYEGNKINNVVLTDDELRKIDEKIGYIKTYYNYDNDGHYKHERYLQYNDAALLMLKDEMGYDKLYYKIEGQKTFFYKSLYNFQGKQNLISFSKDYFNNISEQDWKLWIKKLCIFVTVKLEDITNYRIGYNFDGFDNFDYDKWLKTICTSLESSILLQANNNSYIGNLEEYNIKNDFVYTKWSKKIKKDFNLNNEFEQDNILSILDKTNSLVNYIKTKNGDFNNLLNRLAFHFINKEFVITKEEQQTNIGNTYIAHKFRTLFNYIFQCNKDITDFNNREYSEQVVIIKEIIELMFPELNQNNSYINNYNNKYSATQNRIHIYPIKNIHNNTYSLVFNIVGNNKIGDYYYLYNPKYNTFEAVDILEIYNDYMIVSERFKNRLEDLEEIGLKK